MKLTYALLRKQRTHNLRYIVRTLLMKLAPDLKYSRFILRLLNFNRLLKRYVFTALLVIYLYLIFIFINLYLRIYFSFYLLPYSNIMRNETYLHAY